MIVTRKTARTTAVALGAIALGTALWAQSAEDAVNARQAHMTLTAANFGVIGNMARGNLEYDAEMAQIAADNLAAIAGLDQSMYWPEGSAMGEVDGTKALPAIWEDPEGFAENIAELETAATALAGVAGDGLEAMQAAAGPVGAACGACHETFRGR